MDERATWSDADGLRLLADRSQDLIYRFRLHPTPGFDYVSPAARTITGYSPEEHYADPGLGEKLVHPDDRHMLEAIASGRVAVEAPLRLRWVRKDGTVVWTEQRNVLVRDDDGTIVAIEGVARDVTAEVEADRLTARLVAAIEQSSESIVIADIDARIEYVNPAFERVTGYRAAEVIGENPRILQSGRQGPSFYEGLWSTLTAGRTWHGELVNRRKDGSTYIEEASISPVHDAHGRVTHYVAVKRDVTASRQLAAHADHVERERSYVSTVLADLRQGETPEASAAAVVERVVGLPDIAFAGLGVFTGDDEARVLAAAVPGATVPRPVLDSTHAGRRRFATARVREWLTAGPWVERWVDEPHQPFHSVFAAAGVTAEAFVPVRRDRQLIGLFHVATAAVDGERVLAERLATLLEFSAVAAVLIGGQLEHEASLAGRQACIRRRIADRAFRPVFQPIVELETRQVVGYEALTRFADGTPPDVVFAEAAAVGLGIELEVATLDAALTAADPLPANRFIDINVSPDLVLAVEPLRTIVARTGFGTVLEVTEHAPIGDYEAFRAAVAALGPSVRLGVDDAGAGFATLRHLLELRPAIVKVDRGLVVGIDQDPARRALVTGMVAFAEATGSTLVAEGIETEADLRALREVGIRHGQGYLLGLPASVDALPEGQGATLAAAALAAGLVRPRRGAWSVVGSQGRGSSPARKVAMSSVYPGSPRS